MIAVSPGVELPDFQRRQYEFARRIRDPRRYPCPADVDADRMGVYQELFFNNIHSLLSINFPVLSRTLGEGPWSALVRDFYAGHHCRTPHFSEIAKEFLAYLQEERGDVPGDPPFLLELAHYEWVELALDISQDPPSSLPFDPNGDVFAGVPVVSALAWNLSYAYPVQRIGPDFISVAPEPTQLLVYRDRLDKVQFVAINPVTHRLLVLLEEATLSGRQAVSRIAEELQHPRPELVLSAGREVLLDLRVRNVILGTRR